MKRSRNESEKKENRVEIDVRMRLVDRLVGLMPLNKR